MTIESTIQSLRALANAPASEHLSVNERFEAPDLSEPRAAVAALAAELKDLGFSIPWHSPRGFASRVAGQLGISFPFRRSGPKGVVVLSVHFVLRSDWRWDVTCWGHEPKLVEAAKYILEGWTIPTESFGIVLVPSFRDRN